MNDEAKLGLVAGVLAVLGVAVFGQPKESSKPNANLPQTSVIVGTATAPPGLPPAAVLPAK